MASKRIHNFREYTHSVGAHFEFHLSGKSVPTETEGETTTCLSKSHYTDTDPISGEQAEARIELMTFSPEVARLYRLS